MLSHVQPLRQPGMRWTRSGTDELRQVSRSLGQETVEQSQVAHAPSWEDGPRYSGSVHGHGIVLTYGMDIRPRLRDEEQDAKPKKRRRLARMRTRCYACYTPLWVTDNDEPDRVIMKHRFQRCRKPIQSWEKERRRLWGLEPKEQPKTKDRKKRKGKRERQQEREDRDQRVVA